MIYKKLEDLIKGLGKPVIRFIPKTNVVEPELRKHIPDEIVVFHSKRVPNTAMIFSSNKTGEWEHAPHLGVFVIQHLLDNKDILQNERDSFYMRAVTAESTNITMTEYFKKEGNIVCHTCEHAKEKLEAGACEGCDDFSNWVVPKT